MKRKIVLCVAAMSCFVLLSTSIHAQAVKPMPTELPMFPGGQSAFTAFLLKNLRYPESMRKKKIQGKEIVSFDVSINGEISNVHTVNGFDVEADREAERLIKSTSPWNPGFSGRKNFKAAVSFILPDK